MKLLWLVVAIGFGIAELLTTSLTLIWFSIGAVIMLFLSIFIKSILAQIIVFALVSTTLLVIATKNIVKKDKEYKYNTNLQAILSKKGIVKEEILPNKIGVVTIGSEEWSAISANNEIIEKNEPVKVIKIEGVKLVVMPIVDK
ncbi:MAG: NfeD family protein [Peptostreptococcaceae bacterium]